MNYTEKEFDCLIGLTTEQILKKIGSPLEYFHNLCIYRTSRFLLYLKLKPFTIYGDSYNMPTEVAEGYALFSENNLLIDINEFNLLDTDSVNELKGFMESPGKKYVPKDFFRTHPFLTSAGSSFCCPVYVTDKGNLICVDTENRIVKEFDYFI